MYRELLQSLPVSGTLFFLYSWSFSHHDRLTKLNLKTLEYRRTFFDLILLFKIINGLSELNFSDYFSIRNVPYSLRGSRLKIECKAKFKTQQFCNSFFGRVPPIWNALSDEITSQTNIGAFKQKLNNFDLRKIVKFKI